MRDDNLMLKLKIDFNFQWKVSFIVKPFIEAIRIYNAATNSGGTVYG